MCSNEIPTDYYELVGAIGLIALLERKKKDFQMMTRTETVDTTSRPSNNAILTSSALYDVGISSPRIHSLNDRSISYPATAFVSLASTCIIYLSNSS